MSDSRKLYEDEIDFRALALKDKDFAELYHAGGGRIDFHDARSVKQLTTSLLKCDFGLKIDLPDDRLCPPIPVRYNYIKWLQSLLDTTNPEFEDGDDPNRTVVGLDIGVGSSCIYPLLATTLRQSWNLHGTEIDEKNFEHASRNVILNGLQSRIKLHHTSPDKPLLNLDALGIPYLDFIMCNPPFYSSAKDMQDSYDTKEKPPSAVCTGADVEMITEGGDLGFVLKLVRESVNQKNRVRWFSSMFGKWNSVVGVVDELKNIGVTNCAVTVLRAGHKTRRWAVAWSFGDLRPTNEVARGSVSSKEVLPFPPEYEVEHGKDLGTVEQAINDKLSSLPLSWSWNQASHTGTGHTKEDVWSRHARRKRKKLEMEGALDEEMADTDRKPALAFKISLDGKPKATLIRVRWLQGDDQKLFESFCGVVKSAVDA